MQTTYKQAESLKKRGDELHHREKYRIMYPGGYGQYAEFENIDGVITKSQNHNKYWEVYDRTTII